MERKPPPATLGLATATFMVVANMIGTGVFTSLGFQVAAIPSVFPVLLLWVVGGVVALCGALTYAELGSALPRSGGEYHFLYRIYHPILGFLAGWTSATVGFAAPTALAAVALATYSKAVFAFIPVVHFAAALVLFFTLIHSLSVRFGSLFNNVFTGIKILLLVLLVGAGLTMESPQNLTVLPQVGDWKWVTSPAFAVSLVYVAFAYTGWNAAVYVLSEMKDPNRQLLKALVGGTVLVSLLYTFVNFVFMYSTPLASLSGQIEVGYISGSRIFGDLGGKIMALTISLVLVSTASVMIFIGPRITQVMGEDFPLLEKLAYRNQQGIPLYGMVLQAALTLTFIYTGTFQQVLLYAGFTLILITTLAVGGVFVLRRREPELARPYRVWGYPVTPAIFIAVSVWSMAYMLVEQPVESIAGLATLGLGLVLYFLNYLKTRALTPVGLGREAGK